jgi:hypothetical protein
VSKSNKRKEVLVELKDLQKALAEALKMFIASGARSMDLPWGSINQGEDGIIVKITTKIK